MNTKTRSNPLRRFVTVLTISIILPLIALAPAYFTSVVLTNQTAQIDESALHTAAIDVSDIDENGTVMYTVSPHEGFQSDSDSDFTAPADILINADLIKVIISDDEIVDECSFTLHLSEDDRYDPKTGEFTGYLRFTKANTAPEAGSDFEYLEDCGIYLTYSE